MTTIAAVIVVVVLFTCAAVHVACIDEASAPWSTAGYWLRAERYLLDKYGPYATLEEIGRGEGRPPDECIADYLTQLERRLSAEEGGSEVRS